MGIPGYFVAKLDSPLLPGRFQALLTDSNFCCTWPLLFRELGSKTDLERAESPNKTCQTPRPGHKFPHVAEKSSWKRSRMPRYQEKGNAQFLRLAQIALSHSTQNSTEHCHLLVEA